MVLLQAVLAFSVAAQAATASLPDAVSVAPAGQPSGTIAPPPPLTEVQSQAPLRELQVAPPPPGPFQESLKHLASQMKVIESKGRSGSQGQPFRRGSLRNPAQLPLEGLGFRSIRPGRHAYYGTDDLIAGLMQIGADLKLADPEMPPLAVADIAGPRGGRIALHRSHRNGRDADLGFFWTDEDGTSIPTDDLVRLDRRGRARYKGRTILFDVRRNWNLARALLKSPRFGDRVKWIFVYSPFRKMLLDYAEREEGDLYVIEKAWRTLQQPGNRAGRHDNHFHLRIDCSAEEMTEGCRN